MTIVDIIHANDLHESYTRWPQLVTAFNTLDQWSQSQGHTPLKFDTGDNLIGTEPEDWPIVTQLMNQMHLTAAVPGNHDFDLGTPGLAAAVAHSQFPWMGTNLNPPPQNSLAPISSTHSQPGDDLAGKWVIDRSIIKQGDINIGLLGVTTPKLMSLINATTAMEGMRPDTLKDTAARLQEQIDSLEAQGVKHIILLSHMGYKADKELIDPDGRYKVHGIDVIVGGHSHDELNGIELGKTLFTDSKNNPVLIVQTGKNAHNVGLTELAFTPDGHVQPLQADLLPTSQFAPDPQATKLLTHYLGPQNPLATLADAYDDKDIGDKDDAMTDYAADQLLRLSHADIALVGAADIKQGAEAGPLTNWHLREMIPFTSPYYVADVTGKQLLDTFDTIAKAQKQHEHHPSLLHPSGNLHVALNVITGKVDDVKTRLFNQAQQAWQPIDPNHHYKVALNDFALTTNEYPALKGAPLVAELPGTMRDWLAASFYGQQQAHGGQPIPVLADGRLEVVNSPNKK
jgi:5'-nucleotidase / UDP-sugar diphosphatase